MKYLVIILFLLLSIVNLQALEKAVVRISDTSKSALKRIKLHGYEIAACFPDRWLDLIVPIGDIENLKELYPDLQIKQTEAAMKKNLLSSDRTIPGYRSYATMITDLTNLVSLHNDIMHLTTIGTGWGSIYNQQGYTNYSTFNHDIVAIKISDNPSVEEDEPAFFFVGAHHAREPLSVEATLSILTDLVDNYNIDPWITNIINNSAIWFVPMLNPDGHKIVWEQQDIWWRKNIRDNNNNHAFNTSNYYGYGNDGVDLNRNYSLGWGFFSASDDIEYATYHGPAPFSEPETQAFKDFLMSHPFVAGISFHTYSELVLFPYGFTSNLVAPDYTELSSLAVDMANLIPAESGGYYSPIPSWALYPASGTFDDWAYGNQGIFSYTVELSTEFIPNASIVSLVTQRVKPAARKLLERATKSMLTGHVTDAVTRQPLEAVIFVQGIDDSPTYRAHYMSKLPFGRYYRFLTGNMVWNIRIFAQGYLPFETEVYISADDVTTLDVSLVPSVLTNLNINIQTYGEIPVQNACLELLGTDIEPLYSDANGDILIDNFYYGFYNIKISKDGFETIYYSSAITQSSLIFLLSNFPFIIYDFETNLSNWSGIGNWGLSTQHSYNGNKSLTDSPMGSYQNELTTYIKTTNPINLGNYQNICLSFYVKCDIELDGDYCNLEYSLDNQNWNAFDYYNGTYNWTRKTYNMNYLRGFSVYFRFRMVANYYQNSDGIYIDDFFIYGNSEVHNYDTTTITLVSDVYIYPNPLTKEAHISFSVNSKLPSDVDLSIYNTKGQKVNTLLNKSLTKGTYTPIWDAVDRRGNKVGNGIYYAVLTINGKRQHSGKLLLLK
ncbi:MAG: T9SS type A sorting domain-containing protein [Candidatus Cloacimonetes bacterium]|nr:T9SS type A sorting domain-containing protein [Candidatus Cloacimonadota bacterium]